MQRTLIVLVIVALSALMYTCRASYAQQRDRSDTPIMSHKATGSRRVPARHADEKLKQQDSSD